MPKILTRRPEPVGLTVSSPSAEPLGEARLSRLPFPPWLAAALLGSVGAVLFAWALVGLPVAVAWLTATHLAPTTILETVNQSWLVVHGVPARLGQVHLGLVPLGLTALVGGAIAVVTTYASALMGDARGGGPRALKAVALLSGSVTVCYTLGSLLLATLVVTPTQAARIVVGAFALSALSSFVAAARARRLDLAGNLPAWSRALPRAAAAGVGMLAAGSSAALATAVAAHWPRIVSLQGSLTPDPAGVAMTMGLYLAYLPTIVLWTGSYVLGAGFTVGAGTLVTPGVSAPGILPAVPLFGAIPVAGSPSAWLWMGVGVLAGAAAGLTFARHRLRAAAEPVVPAWTWQGALAGLLTGVLWVTASALARGDLGVGRLQGLGPRLPELLVFGTVPPALAAAAAAAIAGWWAARGNRAAGDGA